MEAKKMKKNRDHYLQVTLTDKKVVAIINEQAKKQDRSAAWIAADAVKEKYNK